MRYANTIGLLVNEIVSNSFKHAFLPGKPGLLKVDFLSKGDYFKLRISDNGPGLETEAKAENTSLGNILIDEGINFILSKSDKQWQLFLSDQLKLSSDKYDKIEFSNGGDLIFAWNNNQFSLINKKGIHVNNAKYDNFIKDRVIPNKDLVILEKNNKQGLVNSKGVEVVPFIYDKIGFNYNEKKLNDLIKFDFNR
jgi:hypothetical protein